LQDDAISQDADTSYTFDNSLRQAFEPFNSPFSEQEKPLLSLALFQDVMPPPPPEYGLNCTFVEGSIDDASVGPSSDGDGDPKPAAKVQQD
jgi:hypothetical protein